MDDWIDDDEDDDDLINALSRKPPRDASIANTQVPADGLKETQRDAEAQLLKAQGEASMLRDRLKILEAEKERERKAQFQKAKDQELQHQQELERLRAELQRAEDEKKFLTFSGKSHLKNGATAKSSGPTDNVLEESSSFSRVKKQKIHEKEPVLVTMRANRVISDDVALFVQSIMSHLLLGSDMTTMEILNHIRLSEARAFKFRNFEISESETIGKGLLDLLMTQKRMALKLDQFIEQLLESLAMLIKHLSEEKTEYKTAIPFLVALMHYSITFRPSAVHTMALKDLFHFMVDLIRTNISVLKKPLIKSSLDLDVSPNIFQYEFIRTLTVLYAFDTLEDSLKTLQSLPLQFQLTFLDEALFEAIDDISRYSLTISYQPVLNVIFNTTEIFNCMANIFLESPQLAQRVPNHMWNNARNRLYQVLNKTVNNDLEPQPDPSSIFLPNETNIFGLIRNIGDNYNSRFISRLVTKNHPTSMPQVIMKEFPTSKGVTEKSIDVEWWGLRLRIGIVQLFGKLASIYPDVPVERNMFKVLTQIMAQTQETLLTVLLGRDCENIHDYYELFSELLRVIFQTWQAKDHDISLLRDVESELTVCLWRIVFGSLSGEEEEFSKIEMQEHKSLVDGIDDLRLQSDLELFEDAFDNEFPEFLNQQVDTIRFNRCREIMGVGVDLGLKEMAKKMLENITSMEDADALYSAMRGR
ncbi:LADA_0H01838g1_1 [Lachancea dasiensis]|uniref:LADA_0H01838g1_1 n=1 Tax=Lachancea dasiensis TaxID=1072105 RepID=A0A1G4JZH5_9SACH|nr:LADA_0H01838g1_1 [Lachancea dasiensis]